MREVYNLDMLVLMPREVANSHYPRFHASARIQSDSSHWQGKKWHKGRP